jgi:SNF2 family DNA or RNA helicase
VDQQLISVIKRGDEYIARFPWSVETKDRVKRAGFRFDGIRKLWWTHDPRVAATLAPVQREELAVRILQARIDTQYRQQKALAGSRATSGDLQIPLSAAARARGFDYYPYQKTGVAWALTRPKCLIADDLGLGKTAEVIGVINSDRSIRHALIICKASLKSVWLHELQLWLARELPITVVGNGQGIPDAGGLIIINYERVAEHRPAIDRLRLDLLCLNESHAIKNPRAHRTLAIIGKFKQLPPIIARRVIFLSGTPLLNRPAELWTTLRFLDPYIGAAREGITLTAASTVIFAELDWVPGNLAQAEARAHRIGQRDSALVQHLVLNGSLDARTAELVLAKIEIIRATIKIDELL